jgi:hypothetical protein
MNLIKSARLEMRWKAKKCERKETGAKEKKCQHLMLVKGLPASGWDLKSGRVYS